MKHAKLRSPRPKLNNCLFAVYGIIIFEVGS